MTIERDDQHERGFASELSQPARRALTAAGYRRLEQLTTISEAEIKQLHGIGPHAIDQLRRALAANEWSFADRTRT